MTIGNKIFELRSAKNLSQGELAELLEVSRQSVSKWETDGAVPELDKLIKMCDIFGVTLDELAGRSTQEKHPPEQAEAAAKESHGALSVRQIVGCILLAVSLLGGVLALVLAGDREDLYVLLPFLLAVLACAAICLCVREHALYWCVWAMFAPVSVLSPFVAGLPLLSGVALFQVAFFAVMAFAARKVFPAHPRGAGKIKRGTLALLWLACIAAYIFVLLAVPFFMERAFSWIIFFVLDFAVYAGFAVLVTYTARHGFKAN